jgi:hypothetical protein
MMIRLRMRGIEEVRKQIERELFQLNDVTSIGTDDPNIIKVGVKKMIPAIMKLIPKEKDGYSIVVEETGKLEAF